MDVKTFERLGLGGVEEEDQELLNYHCRLLTAHLGTTWELQHFFCSYPWRAACALLEKYVPTVLHEMSREWDFVVNCVDKLSTERVAVLLQHTRYQVYRDVMTKAESFGFILHTAVFFVFLQGDWVDTTFFTFKTLHSSKD